MTAVDPNGPTVIVTPEDSPVGGVPALVALVALVLAVMASFAVPRLLPSSSSPISRSRPWWWRQ